MVTGRYFRCDYDLLRKTEVRINRRLLSEMFVSLNELYDELDLPHCGIGDDIGWNIDEEIDFSFSSHLTPNNIACLAVDYNVRPRIDYRNLH